MKLMFKQRIFSWLDSYNVFDTTGETVYTIKGQLSWGHCFKVFDARNVCVGMVKQKVFSFLPRYEIYQDERYVGSICRELSLFRPRYTIDFCGWQVEGNFFEWDYRIVDTMGQPVAMVSKELFNWSDTYSIDVGRPEDALYALMLVLAIDAEKCSRNNAM